MRSTEEKAESRRALLEELDRAGIGYELVEHDAAYTVEDIDRIDFAPDVTICKNLFVRDQKKKPSHWLVVLHKDKRANLDSLAEQLGTKHLSFASADRLKKYLGLAQGEVTPLGVLNDSDHAVTVVFDRDLKELDRIGVHPNDNTAMLYIAFSDVLRFVTERGNTVKYITARGD